MSETNITWDEATKSAGFVQIEDETEKRIVITNWSLVKRPADAKVAAGQIEFVADVVVEDGKEVKECKFTTASMRLKKKLQPILEKKQPSEKVGISILRVGEKFNTQYSVKEYAL